MGSVATTTTPRYYCPSAAIRTNSQPETSGVPREHTVHAGLAGPPGPRVRRSKHTRADQGQRGARARESDAFAFLTHLQTHRRPDPACLRVAPPDPTGLPTPRQKRVASESD